MESVFIISSSEKGISLLSELLKSCAQAAVTIAKSGGEARRIIAESDFDLVIINAPLSDEFGADLASMISEASVAGVILIVKNEIADEVSARVEAEGIFVLPKPVSRPFFYQAFRLVEASRRRILGLKQENVKLQTKIEEIRLIDRAKCVLIQYLNMTEPAAHRYIEKQAMDMRSTRKEIAENILKTYEM